MMSSERRSDDESKDFRGGQKQAPNLKNQMMDLIKSAKEVVADLMASGIE